MSQGIAYRFWPAASIAHGTEDIVCCNPLNTVIQEDNEVLQTNTATVSHTREPNAVSKYNGISVLHANKLVITYDTLDITVSHM